MEVCKFCKMSRIKGKMYFDKTGLRQYMLDFVKEMQKAGVSEAEINRRISKHYTNTVIKKYDKNEQDIMWDEIYHTIMEVPGGYWQIVQNMDYMPEFEHYRFKCLKSIYDTKKQTFIKKSE